VIAQVLMADAVELIGGDPGHAVATHLDEGISGDAAGDSHRLDRLGILDLSARIGRRGRLVDVLGTRNRGRNLAAA